jgi:hypothetical protein
VVVTTEEMRDWASRPILVGHPGACVVPIVIGKEAFPLVTDVKEAIRTPYKAILATLLHAQDEGVEHGAYAAAKGAETLPTRDKDMWLELIAVAINEVSAKILEAMMNVEEFRHKSVWAKEARQEGRQEGRQEILLQLFEKKLRRVLTEDEHKVLAVRMEQEGLQALGDAIIELDAASLEAWLFSQ